MVQLQGPQHKLTKINY